MNERIKELAEQAGMKHPVMGEVSYTQFNHEKFAELIVKECADIAEKWYSDYPTDDRLVSETVKQHFGVEK